jgi:hypothetical protein
MYLLLGLRYAVLPMDGNARVSLAVQLTVLPLAGWAALWCLAGLVAITAGVTRWWRVGFIVLYSMPAVWAFGYLATWVLGVLGVLHPAPSSAWAGAVIFGLLSGWVLQALDMAGERPR